MTLRVDRKELISVLHEYEFIFDVDGVLADDGKGIDNHIVELLAELNRKYAHITIVTGGLLESFFTKQTISATRLDFLKEHIDTFYGSLGNEIYIPKTHGYFTRGEYVSLDGVRDILKQYWLFNTKDKFGYYQKFEECFERRPGMVNFSLIDRKLATETKREVLKHYGDHRQGIMKALDQWKVQVLRGGITSLDFTWVGKEQVWTDLCAKRKFQGGNLKKGMVFGDKCGVGGNDEKLSRIVYSNGGVVHQINAGTKQTIGILNDLLQKPEITYRKTL